MKKLFSLILICALALSFVSCGGGNKDEKVIYIGVNEPATGESGAGGKQETLGIQYANVVAPTVTINGEEYQVKLVIVDNETDTAKCPSVAQTLVSANCCVVLGAYGSALCIAAGPTFEAAGIPCIGISCTNPQVTLGNSYYFRICFLDTFQGKVLADYAYETLGARNIYCLAELGDDYSVGLVNYFCEEFKKLGGNITASETYPLGTSDFSSYIANAKKFNSDCFFAPINIEPAALVIEQSNAQGLGMPLLAGDTWDSNVIATAATGTNLEIAFSTFFYSGANDKTKEFTKGFQDWLKANPDKLTDNGGNDAVAAVSPLGYDSYFVALEAIKLANSADPKAINDALWNVKYTGVTGEVAFDKNGDVDKDAIFMVGIDTATGAFKFITEQGASD
ncbi:MAG: ABC transporter substrate-binding protein [Eubacteriales bacterium]|nr:ABC transporter substrate-binding protein [Eubacteriales bacterium]